MTKTGRTGIKNSVMERARTRNGLLLARLKTQSMQIAALTAKVEELEAWNTQANIEKDRLYAENEKLETELKGTKVALEAQRAMSPYSERAIAAIREGVEKLPSFSPNSFAKGCVSQAFTDRVGIFVRRHDVLALPGLKGGKK